MRHLVTLLDKMRNDGYMVTTPNGRNLEFELIKPSQRENELFAQVQPFVFAGGEPFDASVRINQIMDWNSQPDHNERIDAPFPVFSIECLDGPLDFFTTEHTTNPENGTTLCILVIEIEPKFYGYYTLTESFDQHGNLLGYAAWKSNNEGYTVEQYLERLSREKVGVESVRVNIRLGEGKHKRQQKIRRVVHVRPKSQAVNSPDASKAIDWTHRFEVRGHWVSIPGRLGKDREGNYCVKDFTWRTNYVKGPEHLPLIKKTRVVE